MAHGRRPKALTATEAHELEGVALRQCSAMLVDQIIRSSIEELVTKDAKENSDKSQLEVICDATGCTEGDTENIPSRADQRLQLNNIPHVEDICKAASDDDLHNRHCFDNGSTDASGDICIQVCNDISLNGAENGGVVYDDTKTNDVGGFRKNVCLSGSEENRAKCAVDTPKPPCHMKVVKFPREFSIKDHDYNTWSTVSKYLESGRLGVNAYGKESNGFRKAHYPDMLNNAKKKDKFSHVKSRLFETKKSAEKNETIESRNALCHPKKYPANRKFQPVKSKVGYTGRNCLSVATDELNYGKRPARPPDKTKSVYKKHVQSKINTGLEKLVIYNDRENTYANKPPPVVVKRKPGKERRFMKLGVCDIQGHESSPLESMRHSLLTSNVGTKENPLYAYTSLPAIATKSVDGRPPNVQGRAINHLSSVCDLRATPPLPPIGGQREAQGQSSTCSIISDPCTSSDMDLYTTP